MKSKIRRVYIESRFFGGSGGSEKHIMSIIYFFPKKFVFDINITMLNIDPDYKNKRVNFINNPDGNYDLAIKLGKGKLKLSTIALKKIVMPCGEDITKFQKHFDVIWLESKSDCKKSYYLPRFVCPFKFKDNIYHKESKINYISDKFPNGYYVTVANTYDPFIKGIDLIYKLGGKLDKPLIWFTSENKICPIKFLYKGYKVPKNLYIAKDITHEIIMDTIKKSIAYVSFSRSESFGWAIAEAISLNVPIISRNVGVISYYPHKVNLYKAPLEIPKLCRDIKNKEVDYSDYHKLFNGSWDIFSKSLAELNIEI